MKSTRQVIQHLYTGYGRGAAAFRYALIVFDICTIVFFVITAPMTPSTEILAADVVIGVLILADFAARLLCASDKLRMLRQIYTITDIIVILSLLLAPLVTESFAFLRVLRTLRLLHSYHVLRDLRRHTPFFHRNEEVIFSAVNLGVFVFLVTALVFTFQSGDTADIDSYIDALYFTVSTLTTTGFGDIVMTDNLGRLLAVVIMLVGVALFLRLAQAIFRPLKVHYTCEECGLNRHDTDAVHCKHCGNILKIETEGAG